MDRPSEGSGAWLFGGAELWSVHKNENKNKGTDRGVGPLRASSLVPSGLGTEVWGALVRGMVWGEEVGFKAWDCNFPATQAGDLASSLWSAQIKGLAWPCEAWLLMGLCWPIGNVFCGSCASGRGWG